MCGIVGYVGPREAAPLLVDGLRRLEYRGYDSAGLAIHDGSRIHTRRAVGKLRRLEENVAERPLAGATGIGHTRWATHGRPSEENAHPHVVDGVAVVHNGIIENHLALRARLEEAGATFASDTDTEIFAHLIGGELRATPNLMEATRRALREVQGAYAIAVLWEKDPKRIVVAKNASPLVIGLGDDETLVGSDIPALLPYTRSMVFLEDGEIGTVTADGLELADLDGTPRSRAPKHIDWSPTQAEKAGYKHFMLKEIFEQPRALEDTLRGRLDREAGQVVGSEIGLSDDAAREVGRVLLLACGTSHHAAMVGRYFLEEIAQVPTSVELASEFRGRHPVVGPTDLVIAVSQSGETLDTLAAAREAQSRGARVLAIANVIDSAIPRMADATFYTHAGPEIGVASTKCFTTQLVNLLMVAVWLGHARGALTPDATGALVEQLARLPTTVQDVLRSTRQLCASLARRYRDARDVLYLGRGTSFPIALEGALKLKEISYVHAEGYAAGEMKHGPIALLDDGLPVVVICPRDAHYERTLGNLQEAKARDAHVIAVATEGDDGVRNIADEVIEIPATDTPHLLPLLTVLPLQLYAYYVADFKGTDVDQPRNLAKTVTVE
jgi:glucosamine--fructose-6-phosphate aminotransferase (isomerizing)